jgi:hypothetical protein
VEEEERKRSDHESIQWLRGGVDYFHFSRLPIRISSSCLFDCSSLPSSLLPPRYRYFLYDHRNPALIYHPLSPLGSLSALINPPSSPSGRYPLSHWSSAFEAQSSTETKSDQAQYRSAPSKGKMGAQISKLLTSLIWAKKEIRILILGLVHSRLASVSRSDS